MSFIKSPAMLTLILSVIVLILACVLVSRQSCNEHFFQTPPVPSDAAMDAQEEAMDAQAASLKYTKRPPQGIMSAPEEDIVSRVGEFCDSDPDADICRAYNTYLNDKGASNNQSEDMKARYLKLSNNLAEAETKMEAATSHFKQIKAQIAIANEPNLPTIRDAHNFPPLNELRFPKTIP
jgi:hypothetical protein